MSRGRLLKIKGKRQINCAFQKHTDSKIQSLTDKCVFRYRQSNVRPLLPASDYYRARGNQIVEHSSDNETTLGSSRKLGGAAEHLIDGSEKRICQSALEFQSDPHVIEKRSNICVNSFNVT